MSRPPLRSEPAGVALLERGESCDWVTEFGSTGPLELELGAGTGSFALAYAAAHPHVRFVAFEWRKKYAREIQHRAQKRGLTNLRVLEADAKHHVPRLFGRGSLAGIHVQFPDPWWKRAHRKRALLTPDFARLLFDLCEPGARFDLRTDVQDRAVEMLTTLEGAGFENPLGSGAFHPYDPLELPSARERRYLASGEPVYRARLVRR